MARERAATGEFRSSVSDDDILALIRGSSAPVQSTQDVAQEFGLERSSAFRRLNQLAADERLTKGMAGASRVWWVDE
jgi:hypothetical protein